MVAHLIVCVQTNWLTRIEIVFQPIDMNAHFTIASQNNLIDLVNELVTLLYNDIRFRLTEIIKREMSPNFHDYSSQYTIPAYLVGVLWFFPWLDLLAIGLSWLRGQIAIHRVLPTLCSRQGGCTLVVPVGCLEKNR